MTVLVDARNVLRSTWPNISEHALVDLCRTWADVHERQLVLVFDGTAPGGVVGERELDRRCRLVGTGSGETADDWLIRAAGNQESDGSPFWLVTSDRALREAAGRAARKVIGGGSFARELLGQSPSGGD